MAPENQRSMADSPTPLLTDPAFPDILRRRLAHGPFPVEQEPWPGDFFDEPPRRAAVLIPLVRQEEDWHLLFIRRARNDNDRHSGQVAFPGGQLDGSDPGPESAALREAEEEIGLPRHNVDLLGRLGTCRTITNFHVTPVVGRIRQPFAPVPDPREVAHVFTIPLPWLADPANVERRDRLIAGRNGAAIDVLYFRQYRGELLWGVTARLVAALVAGISTGG